MQMGQFCHKHNADGVQGKPLDCCVVIPFGAHHESEVFQLPNLYPSSKLIKTEPRAKRMRPFSS